MTERFELSRRKTLAGLATIGAAGAGAGLGTSALFSDEETFENNTITAGTLDLTVTATVEAANGYWEENADLPMEATADGDAVTGLQVSDVKPGDWGIICFDVSIGENPGYVRAYTDNFQSLENGFEEPEPEDDTLEEGELDDEMLVEAWEEFVDADSDDMHDHVGGQGVGPVSVREADNFLNPPKQQGVIVEPESPVEACLLLYIPDDVGNVIQGDSLEFDLVFEAEQVRNNDTPFDGDSAVKTPAE